MNNVFSDILRIYFLFYFIFSGGSQETGNQSKHAPVEDRVNRIFQLAQVHA